MSKFEWHRVHSAFGVSALGAVFTLFWGCFIWVVVDTKGRRAWAHS